MVERRCQEPILRCNAGKSLVVTHTAYMGGFGQALVTEALVTGALVTEKALTVWDL